MPGDANVGAPREPGAPGTPPTATTTSPVAAVNPVIPLEGTLNTRDLGGYPVAGGRRIVPGRIFRSATLAQLTPGGVAALQRLGVDTVVDFRGAAEARRDPDRLPPGAAYTNTPIAMAAVVGSSSSSSSSSRPGNRPEAIDADTAAINTNADADPAIDPAIDSDALAPLVRAAGLPASLLLDPRRVALVARHGPYYRMLALVAAYGTRDQAARQLRGYRPLFAALLALPPASRLLMHCTGGRDRTGVAVALLLKALGAPDALIEADYVASNRNLQPGAAPDGDGDGDPDSTAFRAFASANVFLQPSSNRAFQAVAAQLDTEPDRLRGAVELRPELLRRMFRAIDAEHGSFDAFLERELGVGPAERQALRDMYTH